jgi:3,2-trans-enoyl-CoA isomerase
MASCPPRSGTSRGSPHVQVTRNGPFAVVSLAKPPVNTMDLAMWEALTATLDALEADPSCRGVIFQSGLQRDIFTAGNDIMELYAPNTSLERYKYVNLEIFMCSM